MKIHPTAIIDPAAELDPTVTVGPGAIIEKNVKIGEGTVIEGWAHIHAGTTLGKNNHIHNGVILGGDPQHLTFDLNKETETILGDHNVLREYTNISRATLVETPTRLGDHNYVMGNVHFGHDVVIGNHNTFTNGSMIAGHSIVGDHIFMSGLVGVHQFTHIGDYVMLGGCAKVTNDVPHYCMVDGNPSWLTGLNMVGMRRGGIDRERLKLIKQIFRVLFLSHQTIKAALEQLKSMPPVEDITKFIDFYENSERGVTGYRAIADEQELGAGG